MKTGYTHTHQRKDENYIPLWHTLYAGGINISNMPTFLLKKTVLSFYQPKI